MTEPEDKKALLFDIDQTRNELGDTVDALSHKTDVKARAGAKVADVKDGANQKIADIKETATDKLGGVKDEVKVIKAQVADKTPSASDVKYKVRSVLRDKRVRSALFAAGPIVFKLIRRRRK